MCLGLRSGENSIMLERDYFIDETNNGMVNGVPANIANTQANNLFNQMAINQLLQQQGYQEPRNMWEALQMMFNNGRLPQARQPRKQIFPYALGY